MGLADAAHSHKCDARGRRGDPNPWDSCGRAWQHRCAKGGFPLYGINGEGNTRLDGDLDSWGAAREDAVVEAAFALHKDCFWQANPKDLLVHFVTEDTRLQRGDAEKRTGDIRPTLH